MQNANRLIAGSWYSTAGLTSLPGLGPPVICSTARRAVVRHEHVLDRDILAAGAGEADHVPGVDDRVVARRQQEDARLGCRRSPRPGRSRRSGSRPTGRRRSKTASGRSADSRPSTLLRAAARKDQRRADQIVGRLRPRSRPAPAAATCRAASDARRGWPAPRRSSRRRGRSPRPVRRSSGTAIRCRRPASAAGCGTGRCGADRRSSRRAGGAVPRPAAARSRSTGTSASARASSSAKSGGPPALPRLARRPSRHLFPRRRRA